MEQKFSKMRLKEFALTAAVSGALALQPTAVMATAVNVGSGTGILTVNAGNAVWYLNNNITFSTTSSNWGFSEAKLHTGGGTRNDAFDGVLSWHVNASPPGSLSSGGYRSPSGTIDITPYPINPAVGTTVTGAPQTMAGLTVTGQVYFSPVKAVTRSMLILQNPTGAPITVTVDSISNLGSDANTSYHATSSGDAVYDPTDNWVVSCQKNPGAPANCDLTADPVLAFAFTQTGAPVRPTTISPITDGSDRQYMRYTVTVPAGQTRRLMTFMQMSDTAPNAIADAALFNTNASLQGTDYLSGLSAAQQSEIVNWVLAPVAPTTPPPILPKISYSAPQAVSENGTTSSVTFTLNGGTPSGNVTLPIVSTNTNEVTVSPASVTFSPGGPTVQTVTFTGVDDQVVDGDQPVLIQVGPAVSTDTGYNGYSPGNFVIVNRDNDMALPALPFADGSLSGFVDITNRGSGAISSIAARAYDKNGVLLGTGTIAQNLPAMGTVSVDMATLQTALGITGVSSNDDARIELLPVGGDISAQGRIKFGTDTINASAANRVGAANLPSSSNADQFTLRITNLSASPQDARATLYSDSGSLLSAPSVLLASQLAPRASLDLTAASLQTLLGIAPWAGRAQLTMDKGSNFALQMMDIASGMRTMNPMLGIGNGGGTAINYILPPGDATGDSFVRVYNQENFAVPYVGSLYNSSGTLLGSVVLGNATAKGELILSGSQLKSLFGNATWTGPARLVIASDMSSFGAQSTVRHANVLTDVSTVITDNVINHLPDATEGVDIELRIVNPSALTTVITGTLTNSAGQTVGSANFAIGTLAPNASLMLSRANLIALAGTWSGRATLTLSANNAVEVLALLRNTTTGAFTNLSERPLR